MLCDLQVRNVFVKAQVFFYGASIESVDMHPPLLPPVGRCIFFYFLCMFVSSSLIFLPIDPSAFTEFVPLVLKLLSASWSSIERVDPTSTGPSGAIAVHFLP